SPRLERFHDGHDDLPARTASRQIRRSPRAHEASAKAKRSLRIGIAEKFITNHGEHDVQETRVGTVVVCRPAFCAGRSFGVDADARYAHGETVIACAATAAGCRLPRASQV